MEAFFFTILAFYWISLVYSSLYTYMRVCGTHITIHEAYVRAHASKGDPRLLLQTEQDWLFWRRYYIHNARNMQQSTCIALLCSICKILSLSLFFFSRSIPHRIPGGRGVGEGAERFEFSWQKNKSLSVFPVYPYPRFSNSGAVITVVILLFFVFFFFLFVLLTALQRYN